MSTGLNLKTIDAWRRVTILWLIALGIGLSTPAWAQTNLGRAVTEAEIYENPDDLDLNLRYAQQQIKLGNLLNAGSSLERLLYANPDWHSARLLYAKVLYRLDDQKAANRELDLLKGKPLNTDQEQTLERYRTEFSVPPVPQYAAASPAVSGSGGYSSADPVRARLTVGISGDDNAGNALSDRIFGFNERGDLAGFVQASVRAVTPISSDGTTTLRGGLSAQTKRHETFSEVDYTVLDGQIGIRKRRDKGTMGIDLDIRTVNLSGEQYLLQAGPRATVSQQLDDTTRFSASIGAAYQDFDPLRRAPLEDERDGVKTNLQIGVLKKIGTRNRLRVIGGYETKDAEIQAFAYRGPSLSLSWDHRFDDNYYGKVSGIVRDLSYKGSLIPGISKREETRWNGRIAIGKSLKDVAWIENSALLKGAAIEAGFNYQERNSNDIRNDYNNFGADLRLVMDF